MLKVGRGDILDNHDLRQFASETGWNVKGSVTMEMAIDQGEGERTHDIILNARSFASHCMVPMDEIIDKLPDDPALASAERFLKDYDEFKERLGKIDFVDMLEMVGDKGPLPVKVILVDECQDLSDRQWSIIHSFASDCDYLYLAGDDDQAIYEFMGSSNGGFLDHSADKEIILEYSYRCSRIIGEASDNIIRRVKRRAEKDIKWRDEPGEVERTGIELEGLPWRDWSKGEKTVMVLFRHQKQSYKFAYTLEDLDIPYTQRGASVTMGSEAEIIKIYISMRNYEAAYSTAQIGKMMAKAGDGRASAMVRNLPKGEYTRADLEEKLDIYFDWTTNDWPRMFARYDRDRKKLNILRRLISRHGIEIIGQKPLIDISTYHGSKGREADIVVLNTDCYKRVWDEQQSNPDTETRLCYVGITRAKEQAIIILPRTDMYMRALVEN